MDRMQQAEVLGKLLTAEDMAPERVKAPDTAGPLPGITGPRPYCWSESPTSGS